MKEANELYYNFYLANYEKKGLNILQLLMIYKIIKVVELCKN